MTKNLYKRTDWEHYYKDGLAKQKRTYRKVFPAYDIFLCDSIIKKTIPYFSKKSAKICEIGSGDGKLLSKISDMLGCKPYGIEYSREAARIAEANGIETIVKDAFDPTIVQKYRNSFDVIFSYGFIEHILPPEKAIKLHIDLIKPGGYFIIQIPRFRGFNYWRLQFFSPDLLPIHNLSIMNEGALEKLCLVPGTKKIYCKNYGTFRIRTPVTQKGIRLYIMKIVSLLEYITNPLLQFLFKDRGFETSLFSPAVIYIGKKI